MDAGTSEEALLALFYYTVPFIAILAVVIFFHELGHFLVGRWCGARVDAFSLGFGPELCHYTDRKGTRWRLALFPLGGYVKFHGDANAASVPDGQAIADMAPEERVGALASLSVWRRAAIVAAGPIANFLLAIVLLAALFHFSGLAFVHPEVLEISAGGAAARSDLKVGDLVMSLGEESIEKASQLPTVIHSPVRFIVRRDGQDRTVVVDPGQTASSFGLGIEAGVRPQIVAVMPDGAAAKSELKAGDVVRSVDGKPVEAVEQLSNLIQTSSGGPISLVVTRDGETKTIAVTPHREVASTTSPGKKPAATLGISIEPSKENIEIRRLAPVDAVRVGGERVWTIISMTAQTIKKLVIGQESVKQLSGPIGIAQVSGEVAKAGIVPVISLMAVLSVSIGLLNLLPIPLLDGGFLMFFAYEAVRGKALPERAQIVGFRIGLTFVAVLSIFVAYNDIGKIIVGQSPLTQHQKSDPDQKSK